MFYNCKNQIIKTGALFSLCFEWYVDLYTMSKQVNVESFSRCFSTVLAQYVGFKFRKKNIALILSNLDGNMTVWNSTYKLAIGQFEIKCINGPNNSLKLNV